LITGGGPTKATRVTIPERDLLEVPLQRFLLCDLIR
jgi:hypothetical protein